MSGKEFDIAIVGGGASGLMAAVSAAEVSPGLDIIVLEKMQEPAKKLYATGNGRCNYLNSGAAAEDYYCFEKEGFIPEAARIQLAPGRVAALKDRFAGLGVEPFTEEEGRMYPRSLQASSVVRALVLGAQRAGAVVKCGAEVCAAAKTGGRFTLVLSSGETVTAKTVIIASGGKAGIQYGSSGDGYKLAKAFGLSCVRAVPALTKLVCSDDISEISGVRARGRISLIAENRGVSTVAAEDTGEIQFAGDCLSGICTFNISRFFRFSERTSYRAELDLLPEYSEEKLRELLLERRVTFRKEPCDMLLNGILPSKLSVFILEKAGFAAGELCEKISIGKLGDVLRLCKSLSLPLSGTKSWKEAQVTAGGVSLSCVDPNTLEALNVPGLFLAGEVLDIDGPCGGYNLTWAFASGETAGRFAAKRSMEK